jgi:HAD superfamily hydrolase (TIGR01509 family)
MRPVSTFPFRAAVFDMDGTLVDNMRVHARAWLELAARLGVTGVSAATIEREWAGFKNAEVLPRLLGRPVEPEELARLSEEKERRYRALYAPELRPLPGLLAFLDALERAGVRLALATAAPPENRALVLDGLGLAPRFARVIGAEHAPRGKPAPNIYLAAAAALELPPGECLAFEDALAGVRSARAAGMRCVGLTTVVEAPALEAAGAWFAAPDFTGMAERLAGA